MCLETLYAIKDFNKSHPCNMLNKAKYDNLLKSQTHKQWLFFQNHIGVYTQGILCCWTYKMAVYYIWLSVQRYVAPSIS